MVVKERKVAEVAIVAFTGFEQYSIGVRCLMRRLELVYELK